MAANLDRPVSAGLLAFVQGVLTLGAVIPLMVIVILRMMDLDAIEHCAKNLRPCVF
jgi:hypothetical protein